MTATSPTPSTHQRSAADWFSLDPIYDVGVLELQNPKFSPPLSPTWRLLLLNDGYTTRNLCLMTGTDVQVELISTARINPNCDRAPAAISSLDNPTSRRQVWLQTPEGDRLMYGVSWWNPKLLRTYIRNPEQPIGRNLSTSRTELFREIHGLYQGHNSKLEQAFQCHGPFWGRHYILWHQQEPISLIAEVFSNKLVNYIGPSYR